MYYGIGCYVSKNSREGFWGKGAIETITQQLQKELPGLRGFSASNIKNMRSFYEEWSPIVNRQPLADENKTLTAVSDSELDEHLLLMEIRQLMADEFNWTDFFAIGFRAWQQRETRQRINMNVAFFMIATSFIIV